MKEVPGSFWWPLVTQLQAFGSLPLTEYFPLQFHQLISKKIKQHQKIQQPLTSFS